MRRAVFIDRDGTLIKDVPYNANPKLIRLEFYAGELLQQLKKENYLLMLISNQSGIAKGFFTTESVYKMHDALQKKLRIKYNVELNGIYYCPHDVNGLVKEYAVDCDCRKPKPGLILKAAKNFNISLQHSWMIGDILNDTEAGNVAGCKTILINNGNETEWELNEKRKPCYTVDNLKQAAEIILKNEVVPRIFSKIS